MSLATDNSGFFDLKLKNKDWLASSTLFVFPAIYIVYLIGNAIYNVYFHPLHVFPGPKSFAATRLRHVQSLLTGKLSHDVKDLHDKYGEIVRIGPNELSFNSPQAWKDIHAHRHGQGILAKEPRFYTMPPEGVHNIATTPSDADHSRMRRLLAHAFSDKALREQEPLVSSYIDRLMARLQEQIHGPQQGRVDLVKWFNFTSFDIIGDLAFGESFHCLESGEYHSWVAMLFGAIKYSAYLGAAAQFPPLTKVLGIFLPRKLREQQEQTMLSNKAKVDRRLAKGKDVDRPDFFSYFLRHNDEKGMTTREIQSSANILTIAGSETTATLLSGATYYLLQDPNTYKQLVDEVRTTFKSQAGISHVAASQLPYLNAVLEEAFRIYPPVPCTLPRVTSPEGNEICGAWIPGNTTIGVNPYAAYRSVRNFTNPDSFLPERWLSSPSTKSTIDFSHDRREVLQPFSVGPRNCIGKNLANMESRLILARLVWKFDIELCEESKEWNKQWIWSMWEKGPLVVRLREREEVRE